MNQGLVLYKEFIDHLVDMSSSCVDAACIAQGKISGIGKEEKNTLLSRLSDSERQILADIVLDTRHSAIYDVLDYLEWLQCCKKMTISIDGETLDSKKFEGFSCDFIGRKSNDWDWPE